MKINIKYFLINTKGAYIDKNAQNFTASLKNQSIKHLKSQTQSNFVVHKQ